MKLKGMSEEKAKGIGHPMSEMAKTFDDLIFHDLLDAFGGFNGRI